MNRIECVSAAGFLAAAIGFAPVGSAAAADTMKKPDSTAGQVQAKSPLSATAPRLPRVVVTPSPEQKAAMRLERDMMKLANQVGNGRSAETRISK